MWTLLSQFLRGLEDLRAQQNPHYACSGFYMHSFGILNHVEMSSTRVKRVVKFRVRIMR